MTQRISGLPEPAAIGRRPLHELRVADHMTPLHRVTRRAVPIHRRQAHRRHINPAVDDLDQRQIRARTIRIPGEAGI